MEALGIYEDGNELKFAHLRKDKDVIEIVNLEKIYIHKEESINGVKEDTQKAYDEVFGITEKEVQPKVEESKEEVSSDVLFNAVSKYFRKSLKMGVNILQSDTSFTRISTDFGPDSKNLSKKIKVELSKIVQDVDDENFGFLPKNGNEFFVFYHNKKNDLLNTVFNIKKAARSDNKVTLVDFNEISVMNLFSTMIETRFFNIFFL